MSDLHLVNCVNCGRQTMIDLTNTEDNCQFCGKNARKKEVIMAEKEAAVEEKVLVPISPKPKKRKKIEAYYKQNKEAMIADYQSMRVSSFFLRWGISSGSWGKLKKLWGVPNKEKHSMYMRTKAPVKRTDSKEPRPKPGEFYIVITEEDLAKLDDDDFRLCWVILGRIIKNRLTKIPI